jgi:hypothetical protein
MSGIISGLLIGLVVNAIWLILLIGVGRSYGVMRRDSCSRFWRSEKTSRSIIAVVSVIPTSATTKEYKRPATGLGELLAFSYVSKSLYAARRSSSLSSVFTADRFPSEALASSIITIGGSQLNSITELFLECLDLEYEVLNDPPKCVHDRASGRKFETVQRNGEIVVDHGILTRIVNPFKRNAPRICPSGSPHVRHGGMRTRPRPRTHL